MKKKVGLLLLGIILTFGLSACNLFSHDITLKDYGKELVPKMKIVSSDMDTLQNLLGLLSNDPTMIEDENFAHKIDVACNMFYDDIQNVKNIKTGNNADVKKIHDLVVKAMDDYEFCAVNTPDALKNMDSDLLRECISHIKEGGDYFHLASKEVQSLVK